MSAGGRRVRVLLVEDSPDDEELVLDEIRRGGYDVVHERVESAEGMRAALALAPWDIVLSDFAMPAFSGRAALELLRGEGLDTPFIIVSGTVGEEIAVAAMRTGANDYVLKHSLARLCPAIQRELEAAQHRAEQRRTQEQLLISDRMASVGTLAAGVAHEINNPLASIFANLELAAGAIDELAAQPGCDRRLVDVVDELRDAREAAERLRQIIRDLKIFSRAPDEARRGPVELQRVMESSLRMAWNEIRHRARLVKEYGAAPLVDANEARLGQVFLNLVVNAAQAIPEGDAAHNVVRVVTGVDGAGRARVEVTDTGVGIAPENLPRVFDAFFTTKEIGVGTGLGLSICHRIVRGLGGEIELESEVGKGTVVRVLLPPSAGVLAPPRPRAPLAAPARRGRLLIVDDEVMFAKAVARSLAAEHDVEIAASAGDALARVRAGERFDVIICDLMMPQMTGMALHAELTAVAPEQAARIVFVTGGAFTAGAREFLDAVPNQRIEKPFESQQLRAVLNDRIR
ncbi:MAG TPA: response regulator [Polyangia bacterium]|nr:response regulator [Polyangia bacterium]